MYRKHFALTRFPFEADLAPEELFAGTAMAEAEARLKHLLELRAIGLFTGEAGSGKTTICRKVASTLHPSLYRLFYVPLSTGSVMDMYQSLSWELGLPGAHNRAPLISSRKLFITRILSNHIIYRKTNLTA